MNKIGNSSSLNEYNKQVKSETEKKVLEAIDIVRKSDAKFTLQAVCEKAGVSRSYFSKNPHMMEVINKYRNTTFSKKKTQDSKDVIISSQRAEIAKLKRTLKAYEVNENYKEKYLKEVEKCEKLEKQIKDLLESKIDLNF